MNDFTNNNIRIFVQLKVKDSTGENTIMYNRPLGDSNNTNYKWILYTPNGSATSATVQNLPSVSYDVGLGSNNSSVFETGNASITTSPYNSRIRNLSGVFYTPNPLRPSISGDQITFYVAIALKNSAALEFKQIESFDILDTNNNISR